MTPIQLINRLSNDERVDFFRDEFTDKLTDTYALLMLREAEKQVLIDTQAKITEDNETAVVGEREVTLNTDVLMLTDVRYKEPTDDAKMRGLPIQLVPQENLL
jgi:hypothetical protein